MTVSTLSNVRIDPSLKRAKMLGCPPTGKCCAVWPNTVERGLTTLTVDGWCVIVGVEDVRSHGPRWRALMHVDRGEVCLESE